MTIANQRPRRERETKNIRETKDLKDKEKSGKKIVIDELERDSKTGKGK